jgi:hypothetical protein
MAFSPDRAESRSSRETSPTNASTFVPQRPFTRSLCLREATPLPLPLSRPEEEEEEECSTASRSVGRVVRLQSGQRRCV